MFSCEILKSTFLQNISGGCFCFLQRHKISLNIKPIEKKFEKYVVNLMKASFYQLFIPARTNISKNILINSLDSRQRKKLVMKLFLYQLLKCSQNLLQQNMTLLPLMCLTSLPLTCLASSYLTDVTCFYLEIFWKTDLQENRYFR